MTPAEVIVQLSAEYPRHKFKEARSVHLGNFETWTSFLVDSLEHKIEWPISNEKERDLRAFYGKARNDEIDARLYLILTFDVRMYLIANGALHGK
jgi:hypothetical protein